MATALAETTKASDSRLVTDMGLDVTDMGLDDDTYNDIYGRVVSDLRGELLNAPLISMPGDDETDPDRIARVVWARIEDQPGDEPLQPALLGYYTYEEDGDLRHFGQDEEAAKKHFAHLVREAYNNLAYDLDERLQVVLETCNEKKKFDFAWEDARKKQIEGEIATVRSLIDQMQVDGCDINVPVWDKLASVNALMKEFESAIED